MFVCVSCALLSTIGRFAWWREEPTVLNFLSQYDLVLARFSLSPEFIWQALNNAVIFLSVLFFANATLVWMLMLFTSSADSITGWAVRIAFLTLLDIGCASSSLQLGKVHFARKIEKQVTGTWEGWLLIHGGLDYMKHIIGGTEGNTIMSFVHWFLDDNAAFCNGIRIGRRLWVDAMHGATVRLCGCSL